MRKFNYTSLQLIVVGAIATAVCVLGILQYRWTSEISRGEQQRLKQVLTRNIRNINQQFSYDFERLSESFELDPSEPESTIDARLLGEYIEWNRSTERVGLLRGLYLWRKTGNGGPHLESLNRSVQRFEASTWPVDLEGEEPELEKQFVQLPVSMAGHEAVYYPWRFNGRVGALVRPIFQMVSPPHDSDMDVEPVGLLVVVIDDRYLASHYLPELIGEDLSASGFKLAIRTAMPPYKAVYLSDPAFPISTSSTDSEVKLFESVKQEATRRGHPAVEFDDQAQQWELVAQHSSGSLDSAVAGWRRRNLAFSLALLAILLSCVGLVVSVARRAERLGKFQMQFVAGVSHELCTPLTVINSIVENVADGIMDDPAKIREYGSILRDQSARLSRLLDQVLVLASGKLDRSAPELQLVEVGATVAQVIAASEKRLREEQFTLEREIAADTPPVIADPVLLSECVENLIGNAMKYAGTSRWMAVRVREIKSHGRHEIQISVEDRGVGIGRDDLPSVFEPFYRVRAVRGANDRGVGLGLYLVKRMVEAMDGRVSVSSQLGQGSCFALHFPADSPLGVRIASSVSSPSAAG